MSPGRGRVVVVGLGPAGADHLVPAARAAIDRIPARFARTGRHPAVAELVATGLAFHTFDAVYDTADRIDAVYARIVDALLDAAGEEGEVLYAVPGNPVVAERSVALLRAAADDGRATLEILPGLSCAELAWSRLGIDPIARGGRVVDAQRFAIEAAGARGPLLVVQCDRPEVSAEVKLALLEEREPTTPVTVLRHLGLPGEAVETVPLAELDRAPVDHLTSFFVDLGEQPIGSAFTELVELSRRLREPGGCPWDAEQTHHSLMRYLLEESYETVEALEALPVDAPAGGVDEATAAAYERLADELGDLLYQVVFHAVLAREAGAFDIADVARGIHDKLVRRHPHVFGDVAADDSAAVLRNWEHAKRIEQGRSSLLDGIPRGLPALLVAHKLYRKAATVGLDPGSAEEAAADARAALDALGPAPPADVEARLGELLAATVRFARARGVDAESSLTGWAARFRDRFQRMEALAEARGVDLSSVERATVAALWEEAR